MRIRVSIFQDNNHSVSVNFENLSEGDFKHYHAITNSSKLRITWLCEQKGKLIEFWISPVHSYINFLFEKG